MTTPKSPEGDDQLPPASTSPAPPAPGSIPPGAVFLSQEEHNRNQAELRVLRKAQKALQEKEEKEASERARAAGEFDKLVANERQKRIEAEERASALERRQQVSDAIVARGLTGERAAALVRLVDSTIEDAAAAVEDAVAKFPSLFGPETPATPAPPPAPKRAPVGPATPPSAPQSGASGKSLPDGYLSPEEFMATPPQVRATAAFQARIAISQPHWEQMVSFREA